MAVLEGLVRLLNVSFDMGVVPMCRRGACRVPLYKGKGDKYGNGKVFYRQDPPSGESITTEYGVNYQLLAVIY